MAARLVRDRSFEPGDGVGEVRLKRRSKVELWRKVPT